MILRFDTDPLCDVWVVSEKRLETMILYAFPAVLIGDIEPMDGCGGCSIELPITILVLVTFSHRVSFCWNGTYAPELIACMAL